MNFTEVPFVRLLNSCPLCSSSKLVPVLNECNHFSKEAHAEVKIFNNTWITLLECQNCAFAFTQEIPISPTFFSNRYDNKWYDPEQEIYSTRKSEILDDIFSTVSRLGYHSGNLLDVGSFAGKLLMKARTCGFNPSGVELNPNLAKYTNEKLGFEVTCIEFQKLILTENKYQVITLIDVLEHLLDPLIVLKNLVRGLDPGGVLVIKVPNYPMQKIKQKVLNLLGISKVGIFATFGHVNHFSFESMEKVLGNLDMDLVYVGVAQSEKWEGKTPTEKVKNFIRDFYYKFSMTVNFKLGFNICYYAKKR